MLATGQLPMQLSLPSSTGPNPVLTVNTNKTTLIDKPKLIDDDSNDIVVSTASLIQPNVTLQSSSPPPTHASSIVQQTGHDTLFDSNVDDAIQQSSTSNFVVSIDSAVIHQPCATTSNTTTTTAACHHSLDQNSAQQTATNASVQPCPASSASLQRLPADLINTIRSQLLNEPLHRIPSVQHEPCLGNNVAGPLSLPCSPIHVPLQQPPLLNSRSMLKNRLNNKFVDTIAQSKATTLFSSSSSSSTPASPPTSPPPPPLAHPSPPTPSPPTSPPPMPSTQPLISSTSPIRLLSQDDQSSPSIPADRRRPNSNEFSPFPRPRRPARHHRRKRPPDGGWGWVVVFASFLISVIADGVAFSFGTIYVELIKHFGQSKSRTAWVGSLFFSMPLLAGPIASALTDRYGCRLVTIASGVIASIGFLLSSYVQSLELLYVTFSLSGCGLALSYVTGIVIVAHYFEKRRSLATGLAVCGTGIGTFMFPPLTIFLLERFQWQGTLQIHALLFLVIIFCGCLMKDLNSPSRKLVRKNNKSRSSGVESLTSNTSSSSSSSTSSSDSSTSESSTSDCESSSVTPTTNANTCMSSSCDSFNSRTSVSKEVVVGGGGGQRNKSDDVAAVRLSTRPRSMSAIDLPTFLHHHTELLPVTVERPLSPVIYSPSNLNQSSPPLQRMLVHSLRKRPYFHRLVDLYPSLQGDHPLLVPNPSTLPSTAQTNLSDNEDVMQPKVHNKKDDQRHVLLLCPHHQHKSKFRFSKSTRHWQSTGALVANGSAGGVTCVAGANDGTGEQMNNNKDNNNQPQCPQCKPRSHTITDQQSHVNSSRSTHGSNVARSFPQQLLQSLVGRQTGNYFRHIKLKRDSISYRTAMLNTNRYRLKASSCPDIYRNSLMTLHHEQGEKGGLINLMKQFIRHILDVSLLKNCRFTLFCISNSFLYACIDIPYIYMPEYAIQAGSSDKRASYLISVIGIVNTLGIVIVGYIGDKTWIRTPNLYSLLTIVSGVAIFLLPIMKTYEGMLALAALYGFSISVNYTLISVILVDILTIERFTSGYGLLLLIQGISSLIGPPIAGWLFDISGSYNTTFFVTGICIMISGVIVLPVEKRNKCNLLLRRCNSRPGSDSNSMICNAVAGQSNLLSGTTVVVDLDPPTARRSIRIDENVKFDKN